MLVKKFKFFPVLDLVKIQFFSKIKKIVLIKLIIFKQPEINLFTPKTNKVFLQISKATITK
jgi:hypothetical protein